MKTIEDILKPLLNAKLTKIIREDEGFVLQFDNGRTFTGLTNLIVTDTKIVASVRPICGYHGEVPKGINK